MHFEQRTDWGTILNKKHKVINSGDLIFKYMSYTKISTTKLCLYINSSLIMYRIIAITKSIQQSNYLKKVQIFWTKNNKKPKWTDLSSNHTMLLPYLGTFNITNEGY